jgi:hypothetical protein
VSCGNEHAVATQARSVGHSEKRAVPIEPADKTLRQSGDLASFAPPVLATGQRSWSRGSYLCRRIVWRGMTGSDLDAHIARIGPEGRVSLERIR